MKISIKLVGQNAQIPKRAKAGDAAYDLYACRYQLVYTGKWQRVDTGISIAIPEGYYGRVAERSGLANMGIRVGGGVLDSSYRGTVQVILFNHGDENLIVQQGDRIAQLIIEKCHDVEWEQVDELPTTERADSGFGSSGL